MKTVPHLAPLESHTCASRFFNRRVKLQAKPVGEPREVVEDSNDVPDLEQRFVIEAQFA